jgi:hypothetical protein
VSDAELPELVGPFDVLEEIARTPHTVIYAGRKTEVDDVMAVERLQTRDELESGRFRVATSLEMRLDHANILRVVSVGEDAGRPYAVTARVEAEPLSIRLERDGPLPSRDAAVLVLELARAVRYAHQRGVLHGGISPQVVSLRPDGAPLLARFGRPRETISAAYRAPEQESGSELGEATDVYGLGALLHALITGAPPARPRAATDRRRPSDSDANAPSPLDAICSACLTLRPEDRYPSAQALADDLERFLGGQSLGPRPDARSRPQVGLTVGLAVIVGLAVLALGWLGAEPDDSPPPAPAASARRSLVPGPSHLDTDDAAVAVVGDELTLRWAPLEGEGVRYELELDGKRVATVSEPEWRGTLSSSGTHSWRVRALRGERPTAWSKPKAVLALDRLQALSPPKGARVPRGAALSLEWSEGLGDAYELEVDETATIVDLTTHRISTDGLELGRHSWRVRARTATVAGPWSRRRWFEIVPWEGPAPTLLEPADGGSAVIGAGAPIRWAEVPGATGYEIEWDSEQPWASTVPVPANHSQAYSNAPGPHTWRVRARRGDEAGAWSETRTLIMSRAPPGGQVLELEELTVLREGAWSLLGHQPLGPHGSQVWCRFKRRGDWVALVVPLERPGRYQAEVFYTRVPSGGRAQLRLGDRSVDIDGYAPSYQGNQPMELGSVELPLHTWEGVTLSGETRQVHGAVLAVQIVGKDERSGGYGLGIDALTLVPIETRDPPEPIPAGDPREVPSALPLLLLEAEAFPILPLGRAGSLITQDLSVLGEGWSQGQQLWFQPHRVGQWFAAAVPLSAGGRFQVEAFFTRAPGYGRVRLTLGEAELEIDGYAAETAPHGPVSLGELNLRPQAGWVGTPRPIDPDADRSPRTLDGVPLTMQALGPGEGDGLACGLDALLLIPLSPAPETAALLPAEPDQLEAGLQLPPPSKAPPAEAPAARLRLLTPCPAEVTLGDTVSLELELTNTGADATWGGLTVGFPLLEKLDAGAEIRWESKLDVVAYPRGAEVWAQSGGIRARYPFLEGARESWANGVAHTLKLMIRPTRAGDFVLDVRAALARTWDLVVRDPAESEFLDQQEWPVTRYTIAVRER